METTLPSTKIVLRPMAHESPYPFPTPEPQGGYFGPRQSSGKDGLGAWAIGALTKTATSSTAAAAATAMLEALRASFNIPLAVAVMPLLRQDRAMNSNECPAEGDDYQRGGGGAMEGRGATVSDGGDYHWDENRTDEARLAETSSSSLSSSGPFGTRRYSRVPTMATLYHKGVFLFGACVVSRIAPRWPPAIRPLGRFA